MSKSPRRPRVPAPMLATRESCGDVADAASPWSIRARWLHDREQRGRLYRRRHSSSPAAARVCCAREGGTARVRERAARDRAQRHVLSTDKPQRLHLALSGEPDKKDCGSSSGKAEFMEDAFALPLGWHGSG